MARKKLNLQLTSKMLQEYDTATTALDPINLALATYSSSEEMCGKHLFSVFVLAVANTIEKNAMKKIGSHTALQDNGVSKDGFDIKLTNTALADMAQEVHQTGLCNRNEATLTIVTALSLTESLPKVDALVKYVQGLN